VKLYVCWGTFPVPWPRRGASWRARAHPCKRAHDALAEAGHSPDVVRVYGFKGLPYVTRGRREVERLSGQTAVPVLVLDDGTVVTDSSDIVAWAGENPASPRAGY
jgi:glutathione S-transferase